MPTELERVVRDHIADLRRSAVVMSKYIQMDASAEEIRKAANELEAALQAQQPGAQAVAELPDDATEFQVPAEGFTCFHCGTHFASTPKGIRAAREHFGERPSAPPDCVVVPKALPFAVLGEAAIAGVFETGNPKHGWDYLLSKVGRPCTHPQPPSIPEPSEDDWRAARDAFNATIMTAPGDMDTVRAAAWLAALTTYTARLRERIGGGVVKPKPGCLGCENAICDECVPNRDR